MATSEQPHSKPWMRDFNACRDMSLEQKIQELMDREEIRELIARYALRVAHREPLSDLFTEDGAYINHYANNPVHELRGRENLAAFFDRPRPSDKEIHGALPMIHNVVLEISEDEASGVCSNELRITEHGKSIIASGYYNDRFRREGGRWKFVSREITWFHWASLQEGWAATPEASDGADNLVLR